MTLPCFAGYFLLLVQNGQTDRYICLGGPELNRCQDICSHLHPVPAEEFLLTSGFDPLLIKAFRFISCAVPRSSH